MSTNPSNILILEDDESVGNALKEALARAGHNVVLCTRPDEAMNALRVDTKIEFLFCDCLIPQMPGIDFLQKARTIPNVKFKSILMSGIYTDRAFIQEATKKTQSMAFLKKPFDMEEILKIVKKEEVQDRKDVSARKVLYQMFSNASVTNRQKRKLIESIEDVSGFDLPFIYSLLVETKSSGYLNIYHSDGSVSGITFCNGNIVGVDIEDKTTYLGEMLIQSGYASPEDVQKALRDKTNRRIGAYLIQCNQLSPHGFDLILAEQMNIRLSRTITDEKIRINFAASDVEMISPHIDSDSLLEFLHDWIASKVSLSWLKNLYMMWAGNMIAPGPHFKKTDPAFNTSLLKALEGLTAKIEKRITLGELLVTPGYNEKAIYKAIYFLLARGLIIFENKGAFASPEEQLRALKKMSRDIENMSSFEVAEYVESCTFGALDETAMLRDFINLLGEMPKDDKSENYKVWQTLKSKAEEAMSTAANPKQRSEFKEATARTEAEGKLKANRLMDEVKQALQLNQYKKAAGLLAQINELNPQIQQFQLFNAWARLGLVDPKNSIVQLKDIELELSQVPPDERYDSMYPFVMGLLSKSKGDVANARKNFEKSIAMDHTFIVARRELNILESQNKKQDILRMDLKDVVSGFFKRKS